MRSDKIRRREYLINHVGWNVYRWRGSFFDRYLYNKRYIDSFRQEEQYNPCIYIPFDGVDIIKDYKDKHECNTSACALPEITKDTNVFISPNCHIGKTQFKKKFNIANDINRADVIVVSNDFGIKDQSSSKCIVFADDVNKWILLCKYVEWLWPDYFNSSFNYIPTVGDTFDDFAMKNASMFKAVKYEDISQEVKNMWKDVKCIYDGRIWTCLNSEHDVIKTAVNNGASIVPQSDLARLLVVDDSVITIDEFESISSSLHSYDDNSILFGLKALANMNYMNFPSVTAWLLDRNKWRIEKLKPLPVDVSYMISSVNQKRSSSSPFRLTTEREYELARYIIENEIKERMDSVINGFMSDTNLTVTINYTLDISEPSNGMTFMDEGLQ